jgi:predicted homoserine dehydrogenase-like protein
VTKPIRKGELLTYGNCAVDAGSRIVALRKRQDDMLKGTAR